MLLNTRRVVLNHTLTDTLPMFHLMPINNQPLHILGIDNVSKETINIRTGIMMNIGHLSLNVFAYITLTFFKLWVQVL